MPCESPLLRRLVATSRKGDLARPRDEASQLRDSAGFGYRTSLFDWHPVGTGSKHGV